MRKTNRALVTGALALSLAGCSTKGSGVAEEKTDDRGIKTDYGVTDTEINVGVLTDNTSQLQEHRAWHGPRK